MPDQYIGFEMLAISPCKSCGRETSPRRCPRQPNRNDVHQGTARIAYLVPQVCSDRLVDNDSESYADRRADSNVPETPRSAVNLNPLHADAVNRYLGFPGASEIASGVTADTGALCVLPPVS